MGKSGDSYNENAALFMDSYQQLIDLLEYRDHPLYQPDTSGVYDFIYSVTVESEVCPLVGIRQFAYIDETDVTKQHLLHWNQNDIPISILVFPDEIRVYNNFTCKKEKALLYNSGNKRGRQGHAEILQDLKASHITTRVVWERLEKLSGSSDRVDKRLLLNLRTTVLEAHQEYGMRLEAAYNFMSLCIFVKYLEDREMLSPTFFGRWAVRNYTEFLAKATAVELDEFFKVLRDRFNGDLFALSADELPNAAQKEVFYRFFRGDDIMENGWSQLTLFPYNFSVIPIELISNIYETFLSVDDNARNEKKASKTGTYYTPHYLADFMVQQCILPYRDKGRIPSVLDPACGSGVFLVDSFKQQIQMLKGDRTKLDAQELGELLENSVYGVDKNPNALRITCFSLYIALLEELSPKDIMENAFHLPNLIGRNLIDSSFFSAEVSALIRKRFDIIIGNPPWKSMPDSDHMPYCRERGIPIADAQIAQAFMCRVEDFADADTQVCFLLTNSIFTNKNSKGFLSYVLENYCISDITNLEAVRGQLFAHAQYPCSIVTYRCVQREDYQIHYQAFRPNGMFRLLHRFICDKNECVTLSKNKVLGREYIWTVLAYGDEFDVGCVEALRQFPPLKEAVEGKLEFVQGYITASKGKRHPDFYSYRGGSLAGAFMPYGVDYEHIPEVAEDTLYDRPRPLKMYTCPHKLLVKRTYSEACWGAAYVQEPLVFCNDFSTFNDYTGEHVGLLRYLEGMINSVLFRYYGFYVSKIKAAGKPEMVKEDVFDFPLPPYDGQNALITRVTDLVARLEQAVHEEWRQKSHSPLFMDTHEKERLQKELDECIYKLYGLDDFQISVIQEGVGRFCREEENVCASGGDYQTYATYICDYFNYYMGGLPDHLWKAQVTEGSLYTTVGFSFAQEEGHMDPDLLGMAGLEEINGRLLVQRRILEYGKSGFCVIQGREKRNWTLGKAMKMAAAMTQEIMGMGGKRHDQ
ncbi:MAG: N-6 DNA methylase [Muribaculaceae bacterium]|nr:N-6 DNA methylase [Roseburia sp.]MCM1431715.1 N-6 DNA methylase [Muribaculaceae bacterium]MCM1491613.1 N-6 DNA methylase [Muribaculaceae bacterium]